MPRYFSATYEFEVDSPGTLNGKERVRIDLADSGEFDSAQDALVASLDTLKAEVGKHYEAT